MKKWTTVDRTTTADGKTLSLEEHDGDYTIRIDGVVLMTTRQHASEEQAAQLACAHLSGKRGARVLIGGLGFGFTLKAALAAAGPDARVTVAEILEPVIAWNRNPAFPLAAAALHDPRVEVASRDVAELIREAPGGFDSIVLDVDNGPAALSADANGGLYSTAGLRSIYAALRPRGCVAVWSAAPSAEFARSMARAGFRAETRTVRARPGSGPRHTIFLGWAN